MARIVLVYGLISGLIIVAGIVGTIVFSGDEPHGSVWLGYLIMLLGLSAVFVGVKQHRDQAGGGVIGFLPALGVGLAISVVAGLAYVAVWEVYLAATDYQFMDKYVASMLEAKRAAGASAAEYAETRRDLLAMAEQYKSVWYRLPMTFAEIFPVGLLVSLISAAVLRDSRVLPARRRD